MEKDILAIILSILGSSTITALITTLGRRKTDQAAINNTLLENARKDIAQIRIENAELRTRIEELEKKISQMTGEIEEKEILNRILKKENEELRQKVQCLETEIKKYKG